MSTKIDIVNSAYSKLRISGLTVNPSPRDVETALSRLEEMMGLFESKLCLGYNFESTPDANSHTGVKSEHDAMMSSNLAVQLVPDFNKQVPPVLYQMASGAYSASSAKSAIDRIRPVQPSNRMPVGEANTLTYNRYQRFNRQEVLAPNTCETNRMLIGDIDDYTETYVAYLGDELISSFTIDPTSGLNIESSSNDDNTISYRIKAVSDSGGSHQQVTLIMTTDSGRVDVRVIDFEIWNQ